MREIPTFFVYSHLVKFYIRTHKKHIEFNKLKFKKLKVQQKLSILAMSMDRSSEGNSFQATPSTQHNVSQSPIIVGLESMEYEWMTMNGP